VGARQAARDQPDARLASSARGAGAAPQVRAGGVHGLMPLLDEEAPRDPLVLFDRWFREAAGAGAPQPDAMTLATASDEGPSARMVLFKGLRNRDFLFYSNYDSRKGRDLTHDRRAALVFFWAVTRHQVRVYGTVRKVGRKESE